ncbi:hypothetical protein SAMN05444396_103287 [Flavobacterium segetis]|uniref:Uncharacterized protein n=1 Tax=Flavobacterium segetis TaxID=271157 RepID=A0A1M5G5A8_9FLAO|nr:hypothetical protein [Flavobacterium segetis]SHF98977.1 hypothetical protein SAMN05444396_103287 [Flavobacterium segetis]
MKRFFTIILVSIITLNFTFCAMKQEVQLEFPQEIKSIFYQKENFGNTESQVDFYIEFKNKLGENILLEKVYFNNQTAKFEEINKTSFVAHLEQNKQTNDIILDSDGAKEYGNKAPVLKKTHFDLKRDEAILEYKNKSKTYYFKITNLIEKTAN